MAGQQHTAASVTPSTTTDTTSTTSQPGKQTNVAKRYGEPGTAQAAAQPQPGVADQLMTERRKTADSFGLLFGNYVEAVHHWEGRALITSSPSPDWKDLLVAIGSVAFGQVLANIWKVAEKPLNRTQEILDVGEKAPAVFYGHGEQVARLVVNTTVAGVSSQMSSLARTAIQQGLASSNDKDKQAAILSFCFLQAAAMNLAEYQARSIFEDQAHALNVDDMRRIRAANEAAANPSIANAVVEREMLVACLKMFGGKKKMFGGDRDVIAAADKNSLGNKGTLGIEIVGRNSKPTKISRVRVAGIGPLILETLKGKNVSYFYGQEGRDGQMSGLNIVMVTRQNDYLMSPADHEVLLQAGVWGSDARGWQKQQRDNEDARGLVSDAWAKHEHEEARVIPEKAAHLGSVNFGIGRRVDGSFEFSDGVDGWLPMDNTCAGYKAGRYFLENVMPVSDLFHAVGALTIPNIEIAG